MASSSATAEQRYTRVAIALHWVLAIALLAQVVLGWWMQDVPKSPPGVRAAWFNLHKSIGLTLMAVVLVRLAWRLRHPVEEVRTIAAWQRQAARVSHALLYACMLVLPLSGYLGSTFTRYPVRYFGWVMPQWNHDWPAGKEFMSVVHEATVWMFMALVVLHVAAAAWHWWQRDGVTARMGIPSPSRS